ncbi:hypothetical protein [Bifidobacterium gallicum]|uniref:Uncharacterized protein n=1 Tax=Bifidobacterium gallicum DSM 20093 = LMG 11596 TaxID=561180 RepID=D1NUT2_9BIFI|nr:hypothetical protein [Bifidobacterium gallicum]EFA22583.1 hypothetical protein BIFGAL_03609 [Bifidobacterium gallicum DSM 20093 = LMG 11596]
MGNEDEKGRKITPYITAHNGIVQYWECGASRGGCAMKGFDCAVIVTVAAMVGIACAGCGHTEGSILDAEPQFSSVHAE